MKKDSTNENLLAKYLLIIISSAGFIILVLVALLILTAFKVIDITKEVQTAMLQFTLPSVFVIFGIALKGLFKNKD